MRRIILRMIATGSLSAFSTAALPALPSAARASQQQPAPPAPPQVTLEQGKQAAPSAGRVPPRGSLLDLSV